MREVVAKRHGKRCAPEQLGVASCIHPRDTAKKLRRVFVQRFYYVAVASQIIGLNLTEDWQVEDDVLPVPLPKCVCVCVCV